jgi:hypothetical protein
VKRDEEIRWPTATRRALEEEDGASVPPGERERFPFSMIQKSTHTHTPRVFLFNGDFLFQRFPFSTVAVRFFWR